MYCKWSGLRISHVTVADLKLKKCIVNVAWFIRTQRAKMGENIDCTWTLWSCSLRSKTTQAEWKIAVNASIHTADCLSTYCLWLRFSKGSELVIVGRGDRYRMGASKKKIYWLCVHELCRAEKVLFSHKRIFFSFKPSHYKNLFLWGGLSQIITLTLTPTLVVSCTLKALNQSVIILSGFNLIRTPAVLK